MARSKTEALAKVQKDLDDRAALVSTALDKLIDSTFTGANTITFDSTAMSVEALRDELEEDYETAGWTVVFTDLGAGSWRISVN